jgi:hypothetical protein
MKVVPLAQDISKATMVEMSNRFEIMVKKYKREAI